MACEQKCATQSGRPDASRATGKRGREGTGVEPSSPYCVAPVRRGKLLRGVHSQGPCGIMVPNCLYAVPHGVWRGQ
jgi:hypothetical protein